MQLLICSWEVAFVFLVPGDVDLEEGGFWLGDFGVTKDNKLIMNARMISCHVVSRNAIPQMDLLLVVATALHMVRADTTQISCF